MNTLVQRAIKVLSDNDRNGYTIPSAKLYPYQWNWDSCFIALGLATVDEHRAWRELRFLLRGQWPDGMLPHIVFHRVDPTYFPGPEVWGVDHSPPTSGITQPPLLATAIRLIHEKARDRHTAKRAVLEFLPKILAYHRWLYRVRDPEGTGLVAILHPWESGLDNSPAWDESLARVEVRNGSPIRRSDTGYVPPDERPQQQDYDRYLALVDQLRRLSYHPTRTYAASAFRVVCVGFNAVLQRANKDLLHLVDQVNFHEGKAEIEGWIARTAAGFETLWDAGTGFYLSLDLIGNSPISVPTSAGFLPLFAAIPSSSRALAMLARLEEWASRTQHLVPSLDPSNPRFERKRYWRGPVWININWMIAEGLQGYDHAQWAERIRHDSLNLLAGAGFREFYDPMDGVGLGGERFSWSAAIALLWNRQPEPDYHPPQTKCPQ